MIHISVSFPYDPGFRAQVSQMTKHSHSHTFYMILIRFLISLTVLTVQFLSHCLLEIGRQPILKRRFKSTFVFKHTNWMKNRKENCIVSGFNDLMQCLNISTKANPSK